MFIALCTTVTGYISVCLEPVKGFVKCSKLQETSSHFWKEFWKAAEVIAQVCWALWFQSLGFTDEENNSNHWLFKKTEKRMNILKTLYTAPHYALPLSILITGKSKEKALNNITS